MNTLHKIISSQRSLAHPVTTTPPASCAVGEQNRLASLTTGELLLQALNAETAAAIQLKKAATPSAAKQVSFSTGAGACQTRTY